jgi:apolipoprotein D and lipocalin family protein
MFKNIFSKPLLISGLRTVPKVDVRRYCGTWYEITAIPSKQQRGCSNTKADYVFDAAKGRVVVRNSCRWKGRVVSIRATAVPVAGSGNARLIVTFFGIIKADYWVIGLADNYSWALVSNSTGSRCWVLSRTPYMDEAVFQQVLAQLRLKGIDTAKLVKTTQE